MELFLKILVTISILVLTVIMYIHTCSKEVPKWLRIIGRICFIGYLLFFIHLTCGWI